MPISLGCRLFRWVVRVGLSWGHLSRDPEDANGVVSQRRGGGRAIQAWEFQRHGRALNVPETERRLIWLKVAEQVRKRLEMRWEKGGGAGPNGGRLDVLTDITGSQQEVRGSHACL